MAKKRVEDRLSLAIKDEISPFEKFKQVTGRSV
jgi:hypothetical protein